MSNAIKGRMQSNVIAIAQCAGICKQRCGLLLQIVTANGIANCHYNVNLQQIFSMAMKRDSHCLISSHEFSVLDSLGATWSFFLETFEMWWQNVIRSNEAWFCNKKEMTYLSMSKIFDNNGQALVFWQCDNAMSTFDDGVNAHRFWNNELRWDLKMMGSGCRDKAEAGYVFHGMTTVGEGAGSGFKGLEWSGLGEHVTGVPERITISGMGQQRQCGKSGACVVTLRGRIHYDSCGSRKPTRGQQLRDRDRCAVTVTGDTTPSSGIGDQNFLIVLRLILNFRFVSKQRCFKTRLFLAVVLEATGKGMMQAGRKRLRRRR